MRLRAGSARVGLYAVGLGLLLATSAGALALPPGESERTEVVEPAGVVRSVEVDSDAGHVVLTPGRKTSVTAQLRWTGAEPEVTVALDEGVLRIDVVCNRASLPPIYIGGPSARCRADLAIVVPTAVDVLADAGNGDVSLTGLAGKLDAYSNVGAVAAKSVRGALLRARSGNGDVALQGVRSTTVTAASSTGSVALRDVVAGTKLQASSGNGDVTVVSARAREATVDTSTGSLSLTDVAVAGALVAESGNGDVVVLRGSAGRVTAESSTGDVTVRDVRSAVVGADTGNGDVLVDTSTARSITATSSTGAVQVIARRAPDLVRAESGNGDVSIEVPRGRYALRVSTGNGDVVIDRIDVDSTAARVIEARSSTGDVAVRGR